MDLVIDRFRQSSTTHNPPSYRADIDGLRAVAVVSVVLFHAGMPGFSGGYVGVDVFFVISGFLITGIITKEIREETFTIANFYKRRIKRIFPALLLVTSVSALMALAILPPDMLVRFFESLASATAFGSNFYFWKSVDYFSTHAHVQPLLHTWSLAVEEQFYIFYPPILLVLFRYPRLVPLAIAIGLVASFALSWMTLERAPGATFYLLPTRAWELLIGALLALGYPSPPKSQGAASLAGWVGLLMIAFAVTAFTSATPFPGVNALLPTVGAALVIWSGLGLREAPSRLLSTSSMVAVGKASYSFYLWHYPLFAFATYLVGDVLPLIYSVPLSLFALALSFLTLAFLENPVRWSSEKRSYVVPVVAMFGLFTISILVSRSDGLPGRLPHELAQIADASEDKGRHPIECMSVGDVVVPVDLPCKLGLKNEPPSILLWGDSHAMVTATAMRVAAKKAGESFLFVASADCPAGKGVGISPRFASELSTMPAYSNCRTYNRDMLSLAASPAIKTVVISQRWSNWRLGQLPNPVESFHDLRIEDLEGDADSIVDNAAKFEKGLNRLLQDLNRAGKRVILVAPLPEPEFDVPHRLYISSFGVATAPPPLTTKSFDLRHKAAIALLRRLEARHGVEVIYPHLNLCDKALCPIIENGKPIYLDHNHLSIFGALKISRAFEPIFASP